MSTATITLPYEEWAALTSPTGELVSLRPVKGTWTLISAREQERLAKQGIGIKAAMACPRCGHPALLPSTFDPPKELGDGKPITAFVCNKCMLESSVIFKDWDRRKLYCVCYETRKGSTIQTHKEYLHAETEVEARKNFWASHGDEVTHVVGIAPAIGFFVKDNHGEKLEA
jgi:hypothetical protein